MARYEGNPEIEKALKDPEWRSWAADLVSNMISRTFPRLSKPLSHSSLLMAVIPTAVRTGLINDSKHVLWVLEHALKDRTIMDVNNALSEGWSLSDFTRNVANDPMVYAEGLKRSETILDDAEHWRYLIDSLGIEQGWTRNVQGQEKQRQRSREQFQTNESKRLINELTNNGTQSFVVIRAGGARQRFDVEGRPIEFSQSGMTPKGGAGRSSDPGFDGMSLDQLRELHATVMEQRRLQSMSKEDLRAVVRSQGSARFEAMMSSKIPSSTGIELVNPDTGAAILTRRDLINFINSARENTKRLLFLNGKVDPARARRFEEILNG